jgi:hypothetical protein
MLMRAPQLDGMALASVAIVQEVLSPAKGYAILCDAPGTYVLGA